MTVIGWPPWFLDFMDTAVPVLIAVVSVLALHFGIRRQRRSELEGYEGPFPLFVLLWGGLLRGAVLLWLVYG